MDAYMPTTSNGTRMGSTMKDFLRTRVRYSLPIMSNVLFMGVRILLRFSQKCHEFLERLRAFPVPGPKKSGIPAAHWNRPRSSAEPSAVRFRSADRVRGTGAGIFPDGLKARSGHRPGKSRGRFYSGSGL